MLFFIDTLPAHVQYLNLAYVSEAHSEAQTYWQSLGRAELQVDGFTVVFGSSNSDRPHPNPLQEREGENGPPWPLLEGEGIVDRTSNSPSPHPAAAPPPIEPSAISIEMVEEGIDESGKWFQKLQVVLKPGGTLAEISEAIYGDVLHTDELFDLVKRQNPNIQRPQQLRVGDAIEITADPTATYVVKEMQWDEAEGKLTNIFFNGGKEITFPNVKGGTLRMIDFPADSRAKEFTFNTGDTVITVQPGHRLVEYAYRPGDTFQDVVRRIYGEVSANALQDFIVQTKWTPSQWPPSPSEFKRLIVSTTATWEDKRPLSTGYPEEQIVTNDNYRALMQRRGDAGIYPLKREGIGTLYRVEIVDPTLTAKDVSRLLYGSDDRYLSLATQAGINPVPDATGKVPENFNPPLLGTRFDVYVDYIEEWFLLGSPAYDNRSQRTVTRLSNGTIIEEYDAAFRHKDGTQRAIYYPTGYKKIVYRTNEIVYSSLDFLFFLNNGLKSDPNSEIDQRNSANFIASFLWNWAPGIPREYGDNPEGFNVVSVTDGKDIEIVIGPKPTTGLVPFLLYDIWLANPFLVAFGVVFLATIVVLVIGIILRRNR